MNLKTNLLFLFFFLFYLPTYLQAQTSDTFKPVPYIQPASCNASSQYFDISRLACKTCPPNSIPKDIYNCKCNNDYYYTVNHGGGSIACAKCPTGYIQSLDGYNCVLCDAACLNCASNNGFRQDLDQFGNYFISQIDGISLMSKCITCNIDNAVQSNKKCTSCKPFTAIQLLTTNLTSLTCDPKNKLNTGGILFLDNLANTDEDPDEYRVQFGTNDFLSWYYTTYLLSVYRACLPDCTTQPCRRNSTACQTLGNMCVLNLYNNNFRKDIEACAAFDSIETNNLWANNMPWLKYGATESLKVYRTTYLASTSILPSGLINLKFKDKCDSGSISFYASEYSLSGALKSFGKIEVTKLQMCNFLISSSFVNPKINPFTTTNYLQNCSISVRELLKFGADPVFYDIYLKYGESTSLLPIPIQTLNYKDPTFNTDINRGDNADQIKLQRRLFLVDAISAKTDETTLPKYVRYAKTIEIIFQLVENQIDGNIYPPLIKIDYDFVSTTDLNTEVNVNFEIKYSMNYDSQNQSIWISIGVLGFFFFLWTFIRTWTWSRRSGKIAVDIITLFKFSMYLCGSLSNVFFLVSVGVSIYWLIIYKGQGVAFAFIPKFTNEEPFRICLIIAFILKTIDIIHLILVQCSYDIFFIDWERPKENNAQMYVNNADTNSSTTRLPRGVSDKKASEEAQKNNFIETKLQGKVSCWRSLFVANEWNEIQTFRKIKPVVQLVALLFFLKVVNLEELTTADCNVKLVRDTNLYKAPYSGLLRVGMASSIYIALAFVQYIIYNFIYIRCVRDVLGQFIDFCSVANISMFVMTHAQYGFYIHGRSPHGNADTGMQQMAQALLKEENDLSSKRGLEEGSDHQTFSISISGRLSKQYSKVMSPLYDRNKSASGGFNSNEFEKRVLAYTQLNRFLIAFVDNILREMKYIVVNRNFFENIMDLELKEPISNGYFYADKDKSFEKAIFSGQERRLFIFDLLTFLIVDYFLFDYVLAAVITYVVIKIYEIARSDIGKMNISRKTLVDKRFLI